MQAGMGGAGMAGVGSGHVVPRHGALPAGLAQHIYPKQPDPDVAAEGLAARPVTSSSYAADDCLVGQLVREATPGMVRVIDALLEGGKGPLAPLVEVNRKMHNAQVGKDGTNSKTAYLDRPENPIRGWEHLEQIFHDYWPGEPEIGTSGKTSFRLGNPETGMVVYNPETLHFVSLRGRKYIPDHDKISIDTNDGSYVVPAYGGLQDRSLVTAMAPAMAADKEEAIVSAVARMILGAQVSEGVEDQYGVADVMERFARLAIETELMVFTPDGQLAPLPDIELLIGVLERDSGLSRDAVEAALRLAVVEAGTTIEANAKMQLWQQAHGQGEALEEPVRLLATGVPTAADPAEVSGNIYGEGPLSGVYAKYVKPLVDHPGWRLNSSGKWDDAYIEDLAALAGQTGLQGLVQLFDTGAMWPVQSAQVNISSVSHFDEATGKWEVSAKVRHAFKRLMASPLQALFKIAAFSGGILYGRYPTVTDPKTGEQVRLRDARSGAVHNRMGTTHLYKGPSRDLREDLFMTLVAAVTATDRVERAGFYHRVDIPAGSVLLTDGSIRLLGGEVVDYLGKFNIYDLERARVVDLSARVVIAEDGTKTPIEKVFGLDDDDNVILPESVATVAIQHDVARVRQEVVGVAEPGFQPKDSHRLEITSPGNADKMSAGRTGSLAVLFYKLAVLAAHFNLDAVDFVDTLMTSAGLEGPTLAQMMGEDSGEDGGEHRATYQDVIDEMNAQGPKSQLANHVANMLSAALTGLETLGAAKTMSDEISTLRFFAGNIAGSEGFSNYARGEGTLGGAKWALYHELIGRGYSHEVVVRVVDEVEHDFQARQRDFLLGRGLVDTTSSWDDATQVLLDRTQRYLAGQLRFEYDPSSLVEGLLAA